MAQDLPSLKQAWVSAAQQGRDPNTVALGLGRNFRIDFWKALKAVAETVHAATTWARAIAAGGADIVAAAECGPGTLTAAMSTIHAMTEVMSELEYMGCVVLSNFPDGVDLATFDADLRDFLKHASGAQLPWYLGVTRERLIAAEVALTLGTPKAVLDKLIVRKFAVFDSDSMTYRYIQKNFVWGVIDGE